MKEKEQKKYGSKKDVAIVNSVTALRFLGSFLVIPVFQAIGGLGAAAFSTIFLATDWIDGKLARKFNASTFFGALFDGVTDKLYGIMSYALLMTINPVVFSIPLLLELGIVAVQNKKLNNGLNIKSNMIGKIKMWFLGFSIIGGFVAVDLMNMPPFLEYIKYASLDKVASIKEFLTLLGVEMPAIVMQLLTLKSYNKENQIGVEEQKQEQIETLEQEIPQTQTEKIEKDPSIVLQDIADERQILQEKLTLLEKAKILGKAMFDPEYYAQNKDMPIRKLAKDLFEED